MRSVAAVALVVPIHDEEDLLPSSLEALAHALAVPAVAAVPAQVALVLDDCHDRSYEAAQIFLRRVRLTGADHGATIVRITAGNVGVARAAGFDALLSTLPTARDATWLATTDADSRVPVRWLSHQLLAYEGGIDAWAGTVAVSEWDGRQSSLCRRYCVDYEAAADGHVHGANLGFTAGAYLAAGGFAPLATGEDQALWSALTRVLARPVHDQRCPVVTSARRRARAPHGFADFLNRLEARAEAEPTEAPADLKDAG
jgi:hypothetical protein